MRLRKMNACLVTLLGIAWYGGDATATERYTMLTAAVGGTHYAMAAGVVDLLNEQMPDVIWSVEAGKGGFVNNVTLSQGGVECAWVSTDAIHLSRVGAPPFDQPIDQSKFRGAVALPPSEGHWVVRRDSGIESIGDLRGKIVAIGARGSSANARAYMMFEPYDIFEGDFRAEYIGKEQATKALSDGRIDAFLEFVSHPAPPVVEISSRLDVKILNMEEDKAAALREKYPYMVPVTIPGGTYRGIDDPVVAYGIPSSWLCLSTVPEDVVYRMTKLTWENLDRLSRVHAAFGAVDIGLAPLMEAATGHPLHPGAERYYREIGALD